MNAPVPEISIATIEQARKTIANKVLQTPVQLSASLSDQLGVPVHLKLEHTQITGSFKLRGATNAVAALSNAEKQRGVVGVSTGNHGRGLAYAARAAGVRCIICMSRLVPQAKIDGIKAQGAEVRIVGNSQDEAQLEVDRLVSEDGRTMIPPFDHRHVIAGQGTLGLELLDQVQELETILVPVSGGGLFSGVAAAVKALKPEVRIIGISMERGAAMHACLKAGKPVLVEELATLADSLGGGIGLDNQYTFAMTRALVDDLILVSEAEIAAAIRHLYWQERQIVEGSGSVGVAALLSGKVTADGPVAVVLSGGNIDMNQHHRIISGEDVDVTQEVA
ncbi:ectoine utilization protein EutB [Hoeflea phototrophica DFL-43]|uniref:Ectoine utilization protein EutB n=1 Tax=Hoeflea phototrophica (strain DSM 17068 / NCIMB 14078 / DFL-43) TaxID=411684 RepID=A9D9B7_HOEPD|nr:hydroxyectoine utilization dehydratase EutB [Hoeflea phototrophica]EDQ32904.1 ectoine utilization protein EutB [Hoeflea phototrophica DFL-43]